MKLTKKEILKLLAVLRAETVVPETPTFPFRIVNPNGFGYSNDPEIGGLQAKLSIMLEVATRLEAE